MFTRKGAKARTHAPGVPGALLFLACGEAPSHQLPPLRQPVHCPDEIYDIMADCWETTPKNRPSFKDIQRRLCSEQMLKELEAMLSLAGTELAPIMQPADQAEGAAAAPEHSSTATAADQTRSGHTQPTTKSTSDPPQTTQAAGATAVSTTSSVTAVDTGMMAAADAVVAPDLAEENHKLKTELETLREAVEKMQSQLAGVSNVCACAQASCHATIGCTGLLAVLMQYYPGPSGV